MTQWSGLCRARREADADAECRSFQTGRSHILLVTDAPGKDRGALGVVTLEDVVEVSAN
jgi:CBS domain containing-hemolysin-like protein